MLTKGIIKRLTEDNDNHYKVYIPLLRKASQDESDATFEATLSYITGIKNYLKVGDVVFLGFEDGNWDKPVIVGKLFTTNEEEALSNISCSSLEVLNNTKLYNSTNIESIDIRKVTERVAYLEKLLVSLAGMAEGGEGDAKEITFTINGTDLTIKKVD